MCTSWALCKRRHLAIWATRIRNKLRSECIPRDERGFVSLTNIARAHAAARSIAHTRTAQFISRNPVFQTALCNETP